MYYICGNSADGPVYYDGSSLAAIDMWIDSKNDCTRFYSLEAAQEIAEALTILESGKEPDEKIGHIEALPF